MDRALVKIFICTPLPPSREFNTNGKVWSIRVGLHGQLDIGVPGLEYVNPTLLESSARVTGGVEPPQLFVQPPQLSVRPPRGG